MPFTYTEPLVLARETVVFFTTGLVGVVVYGFVVVGVVVVGVVSVGVVSVGVVSVGTSFLTNELIASVKCLTCSLIEAWFLAFASKSTDSSSSVFRSFQESTV